LKVSPVFKEIAQLNCCMFCKSCQTYRPKFDGFECVFCGMAMSHGKLIDRHIDDFFVEYPTDVYHLLVFYRCVRVISEDDCGDYYGIKWSDVYNENEKDIRI
jgi:hypothetical protein